MNISELTRNWTYKADGKRGRWKILDKPYKGDCEDFALTALYLLSDKSMVTFWKALLKGDAAIVTCKSPKGNRHAILRYGKQYTDNWFEWRKQPWGTEEHFTSNGYADLKEYSAFTVARNLHPNAVKLAVILLGGAIAGALVHFG